MSFAQKSKEQKKLNSMPELLNQLLANTLDVYLAAKQAHWNVRGDNFMPLHELFDKVSSEVASHADTLAERAGQLGAAAQGTLQAVAGRSVLGPYPLEIHDGDDHLIALNSAVSILADAHRQAINIATEAGDMVTADIFTSIARNLDKLNWFVRSHLV